MAWTMAARPFFVPNASCAGRRTVPLSLSQGCDRGIGNPRDSGARNVSFCHDSDDGVKEEHHLVSATQKRACVLGGGQAAKSGAQDTRASWTEAGKEAAARETGAIGKWRVTVSHVSLATFSE